MTSSENSEMETVNLKNVEGRTYPARRKTQNIVGGSSPLQGSNFSMGFVTLEPRGGQVPWHNHDQEEVYFILSGRGEMCVADEMSVLSAGEAVYIPSGSYHQLTNTGTEPLTMIYCYGPAGDVAHWRQELAGTLPRAGIDAPPLPAGAQSQHTDT